MRRRGKSLTTQLAWRLVGLQAFTVLGSMVTLTYTLYNASVSYVDDNVTRIVADAVRRDAAGRLTLDDGGSLFALLCEQPSLWFAVADEHGEWLEHGAVPTAYHALPAVLAEIEPSEIHARHAPYALTMRIAVTQTQVGRLHVMAGGVVTTDALVLFRKVAAYLGWRMILPLVLVTLVLLPWLIRRAMSGVAEVAAQAEAIDIDERGARLADRAVPLELRPLVRAFNAALERLNEGYDARDRFLADAAHELRAPIAILGARIEAMESGATRTRLLADVARLANLAEQLLDLQRLGRRLERLEPVDLTALSREAAADLAPLVIEAGYELALDAPQAPVMVVGDRPSLSRVITNLVQNAIAHGGGRGTITVDVRSDGSFGVSDEGPGVPLSERQRIFEPFYRLKPSSSGAGLGLHLVSEIVALHGGRIEVTEAAGGGAWFRVRLRAAVATAPG